MFRPVKITPLPRKGAPLALMVRGILVATVAMALLATLTAYAVPETLGGPALASPSWYPGLARLGAGDLGQGLGLPGSGGLSGQESGEAASDGNVTVNYAHQTGVGSPLIFGGTQCPRPDHTDAWTKEAKAGVTMLRQDWFLNDFVPDSTVEDYKNNINNIQDPSTWPFGNAQWIADKFTNAQSRGMELMAIVDYAPRWLTYSGTQYGVPMDWWVWEDIVKKAYLHFRNRHGIEFDYIEIWNEPSAHFLDVTSSGMTRAEAYKAIYYHTWRAIREVDPHIPIGGPADYAPYETGVLEAMLQDGNINDKIDFVSYHYYDDTAEWMVGDGPPERFIDDVLQAYGRENMPVMLSEYNASCCGIGRVNSVDESISYIGDKFVWFLKRGFLGANYFSLTAYCGAQGECYYDWIDGQAQLKPQAKTWRLASKVLGLGEGPSKVMETTHSDGISAVGATNSSSQSVVLIANDHSGTEMVTVTLENLGVSGQVEVEVYLASSANDAIQPVISDIRTVENGTLSLAIDMPAWSVVGIKLSDSGQPTPITDIGSEDWFYEAVMDLYNQGIVSGYPDGTFRPSNQVTRAEFATMLVRAMGWAINTSGAPHFTDVLPGAWYYEFLETAHHQSVVSGYPDGTFRPDNPISRAEIAAMIVRAMGWTIDTMNTDFPDVPPTHWAYEFIKTARNHVVVSGYPDGTFKPDNPNTRAEAAAMLYRALP